MTSADDHSPPRRLPGGIPIPVAVIGLPVLGIVLVLALRTNAPGSDHPEAKPIRTADLVLQDHDDGSISVFRAGDRHLVDTVQPASNAFLRVVLAGLVRERRREGQGAPTLPFHLTRWSDRRLTIDDSATHRLIELNAFGPDNSGAFSRLLDLASPPGSASPGDSRPCRDGTPLASGRNAACHMSR